jgi:prepilin peptidase CpaA
MHPHIISQIAALIVVTIGLVIDLRTSKIPNWLTFPSAAAGILINSISLGVNGALGAALGWSVGVAIMLVAAFAPIGSAKQKLGMGDVKLMGAMGAFLGPVYVLIAFLYFCFAYGLIAMIVIIPAIPWRHLGAYFFAVLSKTPPPMVASKDQQRKLSKVRKSPIPVGIGIGIGTLLAILLEKQTLMVLGFR